LHKDLETLVGSRKRHYLANLAFDRSELCTDAEYGEQLLGILIARFPCAEQQFRKG